jgi:hypothetical protein
MAGLMPGLCQAKRANEFAFVVLMRRHAPANLKA